MVLRLVVACCVAVLGGMRVGEAMGSAAELAAIVAAAVAESAALFVAHALACSEGANHRLRSLFMCICALFVCMYVRNVCMLYVHTLFRFLCDDACM